MKKKRERQKRRVVSLPSEQTLDVVSFSLFFIIISFLCLHSIVLRTLEFRW